MSYVIRGNSGRPARAPGGGFCATHQIIKIVGHDMKKEYVCNACGYVGVPKKITKGSIAIEIVLWLMFIVPGLIYSIWRLTSRYEACPNCKTPNSMIPTDSPVGQKLVAQNAKA